MEAGLGMGCSATWLWPLTTALAFSATQARGRAVPATWPPASLDENVVALLGSAGHLCCQDRTLGQASCWSCQQLGIN